MKLKTVIVREGRVWSWSVFDGKKFLGGGLCRTKTDAKNDAGIFASAREQRDTERRQTKPATDTPLQLLREIVASYQDEGCDGCGTIDAALYERAVTLTSQTGGAK